MDWLNYLAERDEYDMFSADELPRDLRMAYSDLQDLEEAA